MFASLRADSSVCALLFLLSVSPFSPFSWFGEVPERVLLGEVPFRVKFGELPFWVSGEVPVWEFGEVPFRVKFGEMPFRV